MLKIIDQTLDYIYSFINLENKSENKYLSSKEYSLDNIKKILNFFNNPHYSKKIIHVAGTKGKGSVSTLISFLLNKIGYDVTTFLSPHLITPNERILYNLLPIENNELIGITARIRNVLEKNNLRPTVFEFFFIIYLLFSELKNPDYLVVETGLGGRLDSTNIVEPIISVITPISLDHVKILGNTISQIAHEKAGIIKKSVPVVVSLQKKQAYKVIKRIAKKNDSEIHYTEKNFKLLKLIPHNNGILIDFYFNGLLIKNIYLSIIGRHQSLNFFTAIQTVSLINPHIVDFLLSTKELRLKINGRIHILDNKYPLVVDVAHNKDSAKKLKEALLLYFPGYKWNILSCMAIDKDYKNFYKELREITNSLVITTPSEYKKSEPYKVFLTAKSLIRQTEYVPDFHEASSMILRIKSPVLVTGSFYIVGPFLEFWNKRNSGETG